MEYRRLDHGEVLYRADSPLGQGHVYYTPAGKEGMVLVCDTQLVPAYLIAAALAWEVDEPPTELKKPTLTYKFNRK